MKKRKWDKETRRHKAPSNGDRTTCRLGKKKKKIGRKKEELEAKGDETKQQNGSEYFICCI